MEEAESQTWEKGGDAAEQQSCREASTNHDSLLGPSDAQVPASIFEGVNLFNQIVPDGSLKLASFTDNDSSHDLNLSFSELEHEI